MVQLLARHSAKAHNTGTRGRHPKRTPHSLLRQGGEIRVVVDRAVRGDALGSDGRVRYWLQPAKAPNLILGYHHRPRGI